MLELVEWAPSVQLVTGKLSPGYGFVCQYTKRLETCVTQVRYLLYFRYLPDVSFYSIKKLGAGQSEVLKGHLGGTSNVRLTKKENP